MDQIAVAQFHPGGNHVSANTRCDSLGAPSVNILLSHESVRQITEVMMPHFPKTQTHRLNHLPRITHLNDKCKKKSQFVLNLCIQTVSQKFTLTFYCLIDIYFPSNHFPPYAFSFPDHQ